MYQMKVTKVESGDEKLLGIASLTVDDKFSFNSLRIIKTDKNEAGLFVAMPSYKNRDGEYVDFFHPISKEMVDELQKAAKRGLKSKSGVTKFGSEETRIGVYVDIIGDGTGPIKGKVKMSVGKDMVCDSILVRDGKDDNVFIAMPSYKSSKPTADGNPVYKNYCNPISAEYRQKLYDDIMSKYEYALGEKALEVLKGQNKNRGDINKEKSR